MRAVRGRPRALVLAAGASRRMGTGGPKALMPVGGVRMLDRVLSTLTAVDIAAVVVIGPPHGEQIAAALLGRAQVAWNPYPERGMLSSVQAGLLVLLDGVQGGDATPGALIWPVDVPLVQVATVQTLLAAAITGPDGENVGESVGESDSESVGENSRSLLTLPTVAGRGGHPLWLPARLFAEALALPEGATLRDLRERHAVLRVPVADEAVLRDLDTPAELAAAEEE